MLLALGNLTDNAEPLDNVAVSGNTEIPVVVGAELSAERGYWIR